MSLEMKYFVLKPRGLGPHAVASREALLHYAYAIMETDDVFARELIDWADAEERRADNA